MKGLLALLISSMVPPARTGIVIYGTYIICPAEHKEVMVQLMNWGNRSSLVQAWVDDSDTSLSPGKIQIPFMLTPPVARIGANSGQQMKIRIMPSKLPVNRESIFYLNVLDIPPNSPEQGGKNVLKFTTQNRIKLFYRPAGIAPINKTTFKKLLVNHSGNGLVIKNDSANWVAISDVKANNVRINHETIMTAPLENQSVNVRGNNVSNWHLTVIDDHDNYIGDKIWLQELPALRVIPLASAVIALLTGIEACAAEETFDTCFMVGEMEDQRVSNIHLEDSQPLPGSHNVDIYVDE